MQKNPKSIISQLHNLELGRSRRKINFHPRKKTMYFKPVCASTESELKFNKTKYYHDDSDFTPDNELSSYALFSELNTYPENGSQFMSQFWTMVEHDQQV